MSRKEQNIIEYIVCCIGAFAVKFGLTNSDSYKYLSRHQGLAFLDKHYDIEHTFSIEDAVQDLIDVCHRNGGQLV